MVFINTLSFKQVTSCSIHSIVTTFGGAVIKVEVANFCAAMDTLIDQDDFTYECFKMRIFYVNQPCVVPYCPENIGVQCHCFTCQAMKLTIAILQLFEGFGCLPQAFKSPSQCILGKLGKKYGRLCLHDKCVFWHISYMTIVKISLLFKLECAK